jgi:hypothetical protein
LNVPVRDANLLEMRLELPRCVVRFGCEGRYRSIR